MTDPVIRARREIVPVTAGLAPPPLDRPALAVEAVRGFTE